MTAEIAIVAIDNLLEASARVVHESKLLPMERKLTRELAIAFRVEEGEFLERFARLKDATWPLDEDQWGRPLSEAQAIAEPMMANALRVTVERALGRGMQHALEWGKVQEAGEWKKMRDEFLASGGSFGDGGLESFIPPPAARAPSVAGSVDFELANPRAVKYIEDHGAVLVRRIDETTRDYIRTVITKGADRGWSYDEMARQITARYSEFAVGRPQRHIDSRAHMIAVTEVGNAYAEGNLQMAQRLSGVGIKMEKKWDTMGDERVSAVCLKNAEAGWIPLEDDFPSGHARPLAHPACRCDMLVQPVEETLYPGSPEDEDVWIDNRLYKLDKAEEDRIAGEVLEMLQHNLGGSQDYTFKQVDKFREFLRGEDFANREIHTRSEYKDALSILRDGRFKTQFETGHSRGFNDPNYRRHAENLGLGAPNNLAPRDRPVYGYIPMGATPGAEVNYGAVEWVLKKSANTRTTLTVGDSLGGFSSATQAGATMDRLHDSFQAWTTSTRTILGVTEASSTEAAREVLARYALYVEAQVQGGISMDDIARVVIHDAMRDPVTGRVVSSNPWILLNEQDAHTIEAFTDLLGQKHIPFEFDKWELDK